MVGSYSDSYVWQLERRVKELEEFLEDSLCECFDEYNKPRPNVCDRCRLLGLDPRAPATDGVITE